MHHPDAQTGRRNIFNSDITYLFRHVPQSYIISDDLKIVGSVAIKFPE